MEDATQRRIQEIEGHLDDIERELEEKDAEFANCKRAYERADILARQLGSATLKRERAEAYREWREVDGDMRNLQKTHSALVKEKFDLKAQMEGKEQGRETTHEPEKEQERQPPIRLVGERDRD